jgi:membrane protein implicated in regulation of membrane protease activity
MTVKHAGSLSLIEKSVPFRNKSALLVVAVVAWLAAMTALFIYLSNAFGLIVAAVLTFILFKIAKIIFFTNWRDEAKSYDPETLTITEPFERVGERFETRVRMHGEVWRGVLAKGATRPPGIGQSVRIVGRNGLVLTLDTVDDGS